MTTGRRCTVEYDAKAAKDLHKLDKPTARRVQQAVTALADEPRPDGCRQLTGHHDLWRIRVGDYRVVYTIEDSALVVLALRVAHRSMVYRRV